MDDRLLFPKLRYNTDLCVGGAKAPKVVIVIQYHNFMTAVMLRVPGESEIEIAEKLDFAYISALIPKLSTEGRANSSTA
jgi:hypothetical protein